MKGRQSWRGDGPEKPAGAKSWRLDQELGGMLCAIGNHGRMLSRGVIACSYTVKRPFCKMVE